MDFGIYGGILAMIHITDKKLLLHFKLSKSGHILCVDKTCFPRPGHISRYDFKHYCTPLSRTSVIQTPVCHFNVKGVQISEFVRISELSDKNTI